MGTLVRTRLDMQNARERKQDELAPRADHTETVSSLASADHPNCSSGVASFPPQSYSRYVTCSSAAGLRSASASAACCALSSGRKPCSLPSTWLGLGFGFGVAVGVGVG